MLSYLERFMLPIGIFPRLLPNNSFNSFSIGSNVVSEHEQLCESVDVDVDFVRAGVHAGDKVLLSEEDGVAPGHRIARHSTSGWDLDNKSLLLLCNSQIIGHAFEVTFIPKIALIIAVHAASLKTGCKKQLQC